MNDEKEIELAEREEWFSALCVERASCSEGDIVFDVESTSFEEPF